MTIILSGVAEFRRALDEIVARANVATRQAVVTGGHLIEEETKKALSRTSSSSGVGRDTRGRFTRAQHSSSPPGSPPFLRTGTLRRSIKVTSPEPTGTAGWTISVGPTAVYGRIQELGGDTGAGGATHLEARPYLAPSLQKVIDDGRLINCYAAAWRTAF